jgi:hypothetical protein
MTLPGPARDILHQGVLCYLAAPSPAGPHVTPVVYVLDGDRLWGTTGRRTTKAFRWRRQPVAGGMVASGNRSMTFRGRVTLYDALDPATWSVSIRRGAQVARASARFTMKNARFFAGYARDVGTLPLAWTPPARVIFSVDIEAAALLEDGRPVERWGSWSRGVESGTAFRRVRVTAVERLPEDLVEVVEGSGHGILGVDGRRGPVVLPCRWVRAGGGFQAVLSRGSLGLAGARNGAPGSLVVDRASSWRAARMRGVLLRGPASVFVPEEVRSGGRIIRELMAAAGPVPDEPAVVRIAADTAVWWRGWTSGTVGRR